MQIGMAVKKVLFDKAAVTSRVDQATRRVLTKFGAYVRTAARSSIRKRKRSSQPGSPPSGHVGHLRKMILFAYDRQEPSVVIGPALRRQSAYGDALEALEYGKTVTRNRGGRRRRQYRARYQARPFMRPALEQEKPKLPAMWADSVR